MNPETIESTTTESVLEGDATEQVGGGNENSHNAGVQMGAALGGAYQAAVDYFSESVFPFYLG